MLTFILAGTIPCLPLDVLGQAKHEEVQCPTEMPSTPIQATTLQSARKEESGFGFCSQKSSLDHHRAFDICSIARVHRTRPGVNPATTAVISHGLNQEEGNQREHKEGRQAAFFHFVALTAERGDTLR